MTSLKTLLKPPSESFVICEHDCAPVASAAARLSSAMLKFVSLLEASSFIPEPAAAGASEEVFGLGDICGASS